MKGSVLVFILLLTALSAQADPRQWDHAGVPLRRAYQVEWNRTVATRADGYTLAVWSDRRAGNRQIVAQLLSPSGMPVWASGGVIVASRPGTHVYPAACSTTGGWIVVWQRFPNGRDFSIEGPSQIWAQKLNNVGGLVWDPTGVPVDTSASQRVTDNSLHIVQDVNAGAIISWDVYGSGGRNVNAQHLTLSGTRDWASTLSITSGGYSQESFADGDANGNMFVAWQDVSDNSNPNIRAAKITPQGTLPWGSGVNGVVVCGDPRWQNNPKVSNDGQGGCYIVWVDDPDLFDDLYMQRLNADGQAQWQTNGIGLCVASYRQLNPRLSLSVNSSGSPDGCLAAWEDTRVNGEEAEIYAQKISPDGAALWTLNGMKICGDAWSDSIGSHGNTRTNVSVASDLAGGLMCAWEDTRGSDNDLSQCDVYAGRVVSEGILIWNGTSGSLVANGAQAQNQPVVASYSSGMKVVFQNAGAEGLSLRSQKLASSNGGRLLPDSGLVVVTGLDGSANYPLSVAMSGGRVACVWQDGRSNLYPGGIRYQITDNSGHIEKEVNGAPLAPDNDGTMYLSQERAQVCPDGGGGFFAVWEDLRSSAKQIRVAHVSAAGDLLTPNDGALVFYDAATTTDQTRSYCASDGQGGCFVAWSNYDREYYLDAYVMRVTSEGTDVWQQPVRLTNTQADDILFGLVSNPDGACIVLWRSGEYLDFNISTAKVDGDATVVYNFDVSDAPNEQDYPAVVADGQGGAYFSWQDGWSGISRRQIFVQHLNAQGSESGPHNGIPVAVDSLALQPVIALGGDGNLLVAWSHLQNDAPYFADIYAQKISPAGARLWTDNGRLVSDTLYEHEDPFILPDNGAGMFMAWTEDHGAPRTHIMATHLDANGNPIGDNYWQLHGGGALTDSTIDGQRNANMASNGSGGFMAFWEQRSASDAWEVSDICAQNISDAAAANERASAIPKAYALSQNYPNPFNPTTQISFALPKTGLTTLRIYDVLGRQVSTVLSRVMPSGNHTVSFDASRFASGIYFYRLESGSFTKTKKMVLLK